MAARVERFLVVPTSQNCSTRYVSRALGRTLLITWILVGSTRANDHESAAIIAGRVVDAKNLPVSNAEVGLQAWGFNEQHKQHDDDFAATAKTDFEGKFQLAVPANLDAKNMLGTVWALAKGSVPARLSSYGTVSGLVGDHVTIRLTSADQTTIRIVESTGTPAKDVHVQVSAVRLPNTVGWPMPRRWSDRVQAKTNEQGDAELPHSLPEAINGIILSRQGMGDVWLDANFFLNMRPVEEVPAFTFQLPPTGTIAGQLNVTDGVLPQPLTMRIQTQSRLPNQQRLTAWGQADVSVGADGKFQVAGIATGRILVLPFLPEDQPLRATVPPNVNVGLNDVTNLEIPVALGTLVRGQIRKGDTKEGVAQFQLAVIYGQSARDHTSMYEKFELETDASGKFSARVPAGRIELRLNSIPPGYQNVEWWSPTDRGVWGTSREIPTGKAEFDLDPIDLDPSKTLRGRLINADGEPLAHWMVFGFPDLPNIPRTESRMNCFGGVDTNDKGEFESTYPISFPPAYWTVRVPNRKAPRRSGDNKPDVKILSTTPLVLQATP